MKPITFDLTKSEDPNDYYRSYLTGDQDKDQEILNIMRDRNRHRAVEQLAAMARAVIGTKSI